MVIQPQTIPFHNHPIHGFMVSWVEASTRKNEKGLHILQARTRPICTQTKRQKLHCPFPFLSHKNIVLSSASAEHRDNLDKNLIGYKILTIRSLPKGG